MINLCNTYFKTLIFDYFFLLRSMSAPFLIIFLTRLNHLANDIFIMKRARERRKKKNYQITKQNN